MLRYKKMFALSVILAIASAFILPQSKYGFGWPLQWLEYHGTTSVTYASELFHPDKFGTIFFHLWNLLFGALIIYAVLLMIYRVLNHLNKDIEIGEK